MVGLVILNWNRNLSGKYIAWLFGLVSPKVRCIGEATVRVRGGQFPRIGAMGVRARDAGQGFTGLGPGGVGGPLQAG